MSDTVIRIENISKLYRLGEVGTGTLSHDLNRWWARFRGRPDPYSLVGRVNDRASVIDTDYVWALKDINLEILEGDVIGIIGRNGAGKSTLLKLISRIMAPTEGRICIRGRIGSLLEVGTGMHSEMTARENIFLNGAILGMKKHEIRKQFDNIVDFSGCSLYIDTPIKRFSTGMRVRLGFSVAAFLNPDILIVDEVLAVGDLEFQKRALGKMSEITRDKDRTVLFVSHNMTTISNICNKAILLDEGEIKYSGTTRDVINKYLSAQKNPYKNISLASRSDRQGDGSVCFTDLQITDENNEEYSGNCLSGDTVRFKLDYESHADNLSSPVVALAINSAGGECYIYLSTELLGIHPVPVRKKGSFIFTVPSLPLASGQYSISVWISFKGSPADWITDAGRINVEDGDFFGSGRALPKSHGRFLVDHSFAAV